MAEQEEVSGISLGLSLDTAGFSAGIARAKAELAGLEATPVKVRTEVVTAREAIKVPITPVFGVGRQELSTFRSQIEEGLKATGGGVQLGVRLSRINFGALRSEIAAGIGTVPIKVSIAGGAKGTALDLVAATVAEQGGSETQSATAFVKNAAAKRGIPTRQYGGPVGPRRAVMVGEAGPELAEFGGPVQIHSAHSARMAMWRGGRARAYAATIENQGGTFGPGGVQPSSGYAVATGSGTAFRVAADDRLGFIRAYRAIARSGSPNVGTWLHEGQIDVDPAEVVKRRRQANDLARRKAQIAFFDLKRFEEIETDRRRGDPSPGQMPLGFARGGRARAAGGIAFVGGALVEEGRNADFSSSPDIAARINAIRGGERERSLGIGRWGPTGDWRVLTAHTGDATSVTMSGNEGQVDVHNHPSGRRGVFMERPSNADVFTSLAGGVHEGWVVTPDMESIIRPDPRMHRGYNRPYRLTHSDRTRFIDRFFKAAHHVGLKSIEKMNDPRYFRKETGRFDALMDVLGRSEGFEYIRRERSTPGDVGNPDLEERVFQASMRASAADARAAGRRPARDPGQMTMFGRMSRREAGGPVTAAEYEAWVRSRTPGARIGPDEVETARRGIHNLHSLMRTSGQNPELAEAGRNWYTEQPQIHDFAGRARNLGVTQRQFTDVVAILSSGAQWYADKKDAFSAAGIRRPVAGPNITAAESVIQHLVHGKPLATSAVVTGDMVMDVHRYLSGTPMAPENFGPKRAEFAEAFWDPSRFVIDRWQGRATTLGARHGVTFPQGLGADVSVKELELMLAKAVKGRDWTSADAPGPAHRRASVFAGLRVAKDLGIEARGVQAESWSEIKRLEGVGNKAFRLDTKSGLALPRKATGGFTYASEASALKRLREITTQGGAILPEHLAEAQAINLQIEQMRMDRRLQPASPWVQRMRANQGLAKEFRAAGGRGLTAGYCYLCGSNIRGSTLQHTFTEKHKRAMAGQLSGYSKSRGRPTWAQALGSNHDESYDPYWDTPEGLSLLTSHHKMGDGGRAGGGRYIVGERGPELFVPKRMESLIPRDVMARLPKRDNGGIVEIGKKPFSEWSPPEDGWVIPNHLRHRIPGRAPGGPVSPGQMTMFDQVPVKNWPGMPPARYLGPGRGADKGPVEVKLVDIDRKAATVLYAVPEGQHTVPRATGGWQFHDEPGADPDAPIPDEEPREGPHISRHIRRLAADTLLPSQRIESSERIRGEMEGGPQLIQGRSSVRSALAGISSYVFGGRQASAEARHAATIDIRNLEHVEGRQRAVQSAKEGLQLDIREQQAKLTPQRAGESMDAFHTRINEVSKSLSGLRASHQILTETETKLAKQHDVLEKQAEKSGKAARVTAPNVAQNVASIAVATTGYGLLTQGISAAISAATPAVAKLADEMGGFKSSATATTSALADDTVARHGNAAAAIAGAAATAGLSEAGLDFVDKALRPTVQVKAGGKAEAATSDLLRATVGSGSPQGLYGGYGGLGGSPLLAEFMGGGKGYTEQVAGDIKAFTAASTPVRTFKDNWMTSGIPGVSQLGEALGGRTDTQILGAAARAPAALKATIDDQNAAMKRGATYAVETASNLELVAGVSDDIAAAYAATGDAAGDTKNSAEMAAAHVALIDKSTGQAVTSTDEYAKFWQQAATGKSIADPATVMRQLAQQMRATFAGIDARLERTLTVDIPAQTAMGLISNPLVPASNILPTGGIGGAGLNGATGAATRTNVAASQALSNAAQADLATQAQAGQEAMRKDVEKYSPAKLTEFNTELAKAQTYSDAIGKTTARITLEQANLSAKEFGQTMFYLTRQLSDARGLAGEVSGPNNLGSLQRSAFMVGRQQTSIGLDLQQRQITTQVALAGFQAPGESPEERYARREEAQIRARTQQKQLNLSRQGFGIEGQIFNVQARRGVEDTRRSIGLTQEQHNVSVDVANANKAIDDAGRAMATHLGKAAAIFNSAGQKAEAVMGAAVEFAAQYGGTMEAATKSLNASMAQLADPTTGLAAHVAALLGQGAPAERTERERGDGVTMPPADAGPPPSPYQDTNAGPGRGSRVPSNGGRGGGGGRPSNGDANSGGGAFASGVVGMTAGPTHMYIGEAGRETVAILRNPRAAQLGGGGVSGGNITIMVTGNTFAGPGDDQKLVQKIEAAVMSAMARKGQLLGLRGPSN